MLILVSVACDSDFFPQIDGRYHLVHGLWVSRNQITSTCTYLLINGSNRRSLPKAKINGGVVSHTSSWFVVPGDSEGVTRYHISGTNCCRFLGGKYF